MPLSLLLNLRVIGAVLAVVLMAAGGWKCYVLGKQSVASEFAAYKQQVTDQALKAEQDARAKEQVLQSTNRQVSANYENLKSATATAVSALDADRLRLQATLDSLATDHTGTRSLTDASPEIRVLGSCINRYEDVATDAQHASDRIVALQDYIRQVCIRK